MTLQLANLLVRNEPDRAYPYAQEALATYARLAAREPENTEHLDNLAFTYNVLASISSRRHDLKQTFEYVRKGMEIRERLLKLKPDDVSVERSLMISYGRMGDIVGGAFENLGDPKAALDYYRKCISIAQHMLAKDPENNMARSDLANAQMRAGHTLTAPEQREESLELLSQAAAGFETVFASGQANVSLRLTAGTALSYVADRLRSGGDTAQALERARQAVQYLAPAAATGDLTSQPELAATQQLIACLLADRGERGLALEMAGKAAETVQRYSANKATAFGGGFTTYWARLGAMYEALARRTNTPPEQRLADWRAAMESYEKSAKEWRQSRAPSRQAEVAILESKTAECGREIAGLTPQAGR